MTNITGRCLRHLWGQSVLAIVSRFEDFAKRVLVKAGLPVSDSDWRLGRSLNSSRSTKDLQDNN